LRFIGCRQNAGASFEGGTGRTNGTGRFSTQFSQGNGETLISPGTDYGFFAPSARRALGNVSCRDDADPGPGPAFCEVGSKRATAGILPIFAASGKQVVSSSQGSTAAASRAALTP
jgi:hypothetical protein